MRIEISAGEKIALIGPNGSGKTTLLRALAGIDDDASSVHIQGESLTLVPPARRAKLLAFLPASRDVRWPIPVRDVIALGLAKPDPARVDQLLERLRLKECVVSIDAAGCQREIARVITEKIGFWT